MVSAAASVEWDENGSVRRIHGLDYNAGYVSLDNMQQTANHFLVGYPELFGITQLDIQELRVGLIQSLIEKQKIPVLRFNQYYKGVKIRGGSVSFYFNREGRIQSVINDLAPDLSCLTNPQITQAEAEDIYRELLNETGDKLNVDSARLRSELMIDGHIENKRLYWMVSGGGYLGLIDALNGEAFYFEDNSANFYSARAKVYLDQPAYNSGTESQQWVNFFDGKYYTGPLPHPWTVPFGKYFKMYDFLTKDVDDFVYTIRSFDKPIWGPDIPWFNFADTDTRNAVGNTYWHLEQVATQYEEWGFDDTLYGLENDPYELTILIHWNEGPQFDPGGMITGPFYVNSAYDQDHDAWPTIALTESNYTNTGCSDTPHVMYHEYFHFVKNAVTGDAPNNFYMCYDNWWALNEALAKFMSASMYNIGPNRWDGAQINCYPGEYNWYFVTNWSCCLEDYDGNAGGNPHDMGLSLTQGLWKARSLIEAVNAGDGQSFVNQSVFYALLTMDQQESLYTAAQKIDEAAGNLQDVWCNYQYPCAYSLYAQKVNQGLYDHGYLRETCTYTACMEPGSVFCQRRDGCISAPAACTGC